MLFDSNTMAFAFAAMILTITPGADTMLVIRNVLKGNTKDGIVTTFGICSGLFVHAMLSAFGVSVILMHSAMLYSLVKTAGAVYLLFLGFQSIYGAVKPGKDGLHHQAFTDGVNSSMEKPRVRAVSLKKRFIEGFLTNVLNPKVVLFYLAFLPQFIGPNDPVILKSIMLTGIHYVMGIVWLVWLSVFLDRARRFVTRPSFKRSLDGFCGILLFGIGLKLIFEKSR